jgi:serine/threonine protein kinase
VCDRFEADWRAGRSPRIESYLGAVAEAERPALRRELLRMEIELLRDRGDRADPEAYRRRFPEEAALIDAELGPPVGGRGDPPDPFPGEYRLSRRLGAGALGEVWLAEDLRLGRLVALKALRPPGGTEAALRVRALMHLENEARIMASIHHPNVVQIYAWRQSGPDPYLVLQYVAGGSLADWIGRVGPLPWERAARYVADVGEGLLEAHRRGVIHRDIKPANILLDEEADEVLLTDFGLSAALGSPTSPAGTLAYMSPEALDGGAAPAGDVYSLAASLFHLATGEPPFPAGSPEELRRRAERGLPEPDARCDVLPEPLERVIRAGLAARLGSRPPLSEFIAALRGTLNRLLADSLAAPTDGAYGPSPVDLRMTIRRWIDGHGFTPVAVTHPPPSGALRDVKRVPLPPDSLGVRTGDRLRIEVTADRPGHVSVVNVGPAGQVNLLYPEDFGGAVPPPVGSYRPLHVEGLELTPPAGRERLFAVWSRTPLDWPELLGLVDPAQCPGLYRATRAMDRLRASVRRRPEDRHVVILELDHRPD